MFGQRQFGVGVTLGFRNAARSGMRSARRDFKQLKDSAKDADEQTQKSLERISLGLQKSRRNFAIGLAGVGAAAYMTTWNKKTEKSISELKSLSVAGAKDIVDSVRKELSNIPADYDQSISGIYKLASAGIKNRTDLIAATKWAMKTAIATKGTTEEAMEILSKDYTNQVLDMFDGNIDQKIRQWSNIVSGTVNAFNVELPGLSKQYSMAAGMAASAGYRPEDTYTALGAIMTGGNAQQAGTGLKAIIRQLPKAEKELGLTFHTKDNRAKTPLQIADEITKKFGDGFLTGRFFKEGGQLQKAFGEEGYSAIIAVLRQQKSLKEASTNVRNSEYTDYMAGQITDNLEGELALFGNRMKSLKDTIGRGGEIRGLIRDASSLVSKLDDLLKENPWLVKAGITAMGLGGSIMALTAAVNYVGLSIMSLSLIGGASGIAPAIATQASTAGTVFGTVFGTNAVAALTPILATGGVALAAILAAAVGAHFIAKNSESYGVPKDAESNVVIPGPLGLEREYNTYGRHMERVPSKPVSMDDYKGPVFDIDGPIDTQKIIESEGQIRIVPQQKTAQVVQNNNITIHAATFEEAQRKAQQFLRKRDAELKRLLDQRRGAPAGAS